MASEWVTLTVDDVPMQTYVAMPSGGGPFPAIIVAQHATGVDSFIQSMCDRLAEAGYAAAAPDLYHRRPAHISLEEVAKMKFGEPPLEAIRATMEDEGTVRDVNAAIAHLSSLSNVDGAVVGVTGFCGGGRVAYLMATRNAKLKAAAWFYPGGAFQSKGGGPSPFAASDRIVCPVMGFFGKDDQNPSPADMERMEKELTRLRVEHTFHAYDGAAHAFMNHTSAVTYREEAAKDAWPKLLAFFDEKLKAVVRAGR